MSTDGGPAGGAVTGGGVPIDEGPAGGVSADGVRGAAALGAEEMPDGAAPAESAESDMPSVSAEPDVSAATVVIPSALAGFAGGRSRIRVALGEARDRPRLPLSALLDQLAREAPALERRIRDERGVVRGHVNVYLDGVDIRELAGVGTVVVPGATVHIIAAVSGG